MVVLTLDIIVLGLVAAMVLTLASVLGWHGLTERRVRRVRTRIQRRSDKALREIAFEANRLRKELFDEVAKLPPEPPSSP